MLTLFFYWTGVIIWSAVALIAVLVVLLGAVQFIMALASTVMQEIWIRRARIKRNNVTFWYIVRQDMFGCTPAELWTHGVCKYARYAKKRYVPIKGGFVKLDPVEKLDDLPLEPHNRPFPGK